MEKHPKKRQKTETGEIDILSSESSSEEVGSSSEEEEYSL